MTDVLTRAALEVHRPLEVLPYAAFRRFHEDGDRLTWETLYFARRRRLETLALAVLSGQGDAYIGPLEDVLWAVCEETTWALPAHLEGHRDAARTVDLFAAETASALAEILGLAETRLSDAVRQRVAAEVQRRVLEPYLAHRPRWSWERARHNWAAVCAGGVAIAALWLSDSETLARVLRRVGPTLEAYLDGFAADGLCLEGMGYWTYGMGYFVAAAELVLDRSRGMVDLLGREDLRPKLTAIAGFPQAGRLGRRAFVRFSDAPEEHRYPPGTVAKLSRRLGLGVDDPTLAEDRDFDTCARWVRHLRDIVWTAEASIRAPEPGAHWYPQAQWLIVRGGEAGWALKGGHNAEPHNHNDVGSFQLVVGDDGLVDDLGAGLYTKDYFGPRRYEAFVTSSFSHSLPIIDGQGQTSGESHRARGVRASVERGTWRAELADAYSLPALTSLVRSARFRPDSFHQIRLTDAVQFADSAAHEVRWRLVTRCAVEVAPRSPVRIRGAESMLEIRPRIAPKAVQVTTQSYASHEGTDRTAWCVDFVYEVTGASRLAFRLGWTQLPKKKG